MAKHVINDGYNMVMSVTKSPHKNGMYNPNETTRYFIIMIGISGHNCSSMGVFPHGGGIPIAGWLRKSDSKMDYFADMCATLKRLDLDL